MSSAGLDQKKHRLVVLVGAEPHVRSLLDILRSAYPHYSLPTVEVHKYLSHAPLRVRLFVTSQLVASTPLTPTPTLLCERHPIPPPPCGESMVAYLPCRDKQRARDKQYARPGAFPQQEGRGGSVHAPVFTCIPPLPPAAIAVPVDNGVLESGGGGLGQIKADTIGKPNGADTGTGADVGTAAGVGGASNVLPSGQEVSPVASPDIIGHLVPFIDRDYLFVAGVSRVWNNAWNQHQRPKETLWMTTTTTPSQLRRSFACGLEPSLLVCLEAARLKQLPLLKVAREEGCDWNVVVTCELAGSGFSEGLKWACSVDNPIPWNSEVCDLAAQSGDMELVAWLLRKGCPCSALTMAAIAASDGLNEDVDTGGLLQWARSVGVPWDVSTTANLAFLGRREILEWTTGEGCEIGMETTAAAARGGQLEVLKWLRSRGCFWDTTTCEGVSSCSCCQVAQPMRSRKKSRPSRQRLLRKAAFPVCSPDKGATFTDGHRFNSDDVLMCGSSLKDGCRPPLLTST